MFISIYTATFTMIKYAVFLDNGLPICSYKVASCTYT
jgi:hypothetical protein